MIDGFWAAKDKCSRYPSLGFPVLAIALPVAFKLYAKGSAIEKRQDAINLAEARRRVASGKLSICDFIKIGHYTDEEFAQCEAVKSRQTNTDNR